MTARDTLAALLSDLPDERVVQLLEYAKFLTWQEEQSTWQEFGRRQFARAYGDNEPEYTETDLKRNPVP